MFVSWKKWGDCSHAIIAAKLIILVQNSLLIAIYLHIPTRFQAYWPHEAVEKTAACPSLTSEIRKIPIKQVDLPYKCNESEFLRFIAFHGLKNEYELWIMFYQLYEALFSTLTGEEVQQRAESRANLQPPAVKSDKCASPVKKAPKVNLAEDIQRLEVALFNGTPLAPGYCIDIRLQDLLTICPRSRRRRDSYRGLVKALAVRGITLKIN